MMSETNVTFAQHISACEVFGVAKNFKLSAFSGQHNKQQATSNKQQATSNKQQATSNKQQATSNKQQATSNKQQATSNKQLC